MPAVEQRHVEMLLPRPDAVGDGGRGDAELLGGADEALMAGGGLEEAQAFERGRSSTLKNLSGEAACSGQYATVSSHILRCGGKRGRFGGRLGWR